jgi:hypothetical protein
VINHTKAPLLSGIFGQLKLVSKISSAAAGDLQAALHEKILEVISGGMPAVF